MKKFICITCCPELDEGNGLKINAYKVHCTDNEKGIEEKNDRGDYCPCGNREVWIEADVMKALMDKFHLCLHTWIDLPKYAYTEEYQRAFIEFVKLKVEAGTVIDPSLAVMTLHHEVGKAHPYFEFDRCDK